MSPPFFDIMFIRSSIYRFRQNAKNSLPVLPFLLKASDNFVKPDMSANKDTVSISIDIGGFEVFFILLFRMFWIRIAGR